MKQSKILALSDSTFTSRADGQVLSGLEALTAYATQGGGLVKISLWEGHLVIAWYKDHKVTFAERFLIS